MFEWIAHALAGAPLIQGLDSGKGAPLNHQKAASPDFLLVTRDGLRLVIEVKNCASDSSPPAKTFLRDYLERLVDYAGQLGAEVKVAVFWSRHALWTLADIAFLLSGSRDSKIRLNMLDALAESEMALVGDRWIHLRPYPFRFRMDFDVLSREPSTGSREQVGLRVSKVAMTLGAAPLVDKRDASVVWYLALFGFDMRGGDDLVLDSDDKAHIEVVAGDDSQTEESQMLTVGPLSSVLARQYRALSCDDGGRLTSVPFKLVTSDHPARVPASGYQGEAVGFVYFVLSPRHAGERV